MNRKLLVLILVPTAVFVLALGGFLLWFLGGEENAVKKNANQLAAAIVSGDPSGAPDGGDVYVRGVRARFGRVQSAQLISQYKKSDNGGPDTADDTSYWLAQIALRTEHGPAVIEVRYDNNSFNPKNQDIRTVYEVKRDHSQGPDLALAASVAEGPAPVAPAPAPPRVADDPALRCVQHAKGDVEKLQRCAGLR